MTDIEWGAEIAVDGVRFDWLTDVDTTTIKWSVHTSPDDFCVAQHDGWKRFKGDDWEALHAIRLPANHDYYKATSRGFTYWPGGESAPDDWDGGECLFKCEEAWVPGTPDDSFRDIIIGYRKRTEQPAPAIAPELVERMVELVRELGKQYEGGFYNSISWVVEVKAILAELEPDPDLTLAKSIVGDAEAIALAIKAAREKGRG